MMKAQDCSTLVLTETDPAIHEAGFIEQVLAGLGDGRSNNDRYSLLSMIGLERLLKFDDPDTLDLVVGDILAALAPGNNGRLVVAARGNPAELVSRFRSHSDLAAADLKIYGVNLNLFTQDREPANQLIVSCMDWRMHGRAGGLIEAFYRSRGAGRYSLLATAGGAKELASNMPRFNMIAAMLDESVRRKRQIKTIYLTSHTDCDTYGASHMFGDNPREEHLALANDLYQAAKDLSRRLPPVPVVPAIVTLRGDRVGAVRHPIDFAP